MLEDVFTASFVVDAFVMTVLEVEGWWWSGGRRLLLLLF
jgi:hypothetical protein